jgi:hypothetical protein
MELQKHIFEIDGKTIGGQGIEKTPLPDCQWCGPSCVEKSVQH